MKTKVQNSKKQKGITLIALVITIIVLLILAGVAINMAINSDGLFAKAKEAAQKTEDAVKQEDQEIQKLLDYANSELEDKPEDEEPEEQPDIPMKNAIFSDGMELTWEELKLDVNGSKYNYDASAITDTEIGDSAFGSCLELVSINIPEGVTNIGRAAFIECSVVNVTLPNSLTTIDDLAFWDTGIKTFNIPSSVTSIGKSTFFHFENINVDSANPNYSSVDGALYNKNKTTLIKYPFSKGVDSYVMPDSVTNIEGSAFACTDGLKSITLNNNVTVYGSTFDEAFSLEAIYVKADNSKYVSSDGVLYTKDMKKLIRYPYSKTDETYTVPSSVNTIDHSAFHQGLGPANIIIQTPITVEGGLGECPFQTVTFPENIEAETVYAFAGLYLVTINYGGTIEQWNALDLDERWNEMIEFMPIEQVICSNGTISIR